MGTNSSKRICPAALAGSLDNRLRRFLQNPRNILAPFIRKGMTVLDLGCGPGFFTVEIGRLLENEGKVIAADLQEGMLERLRGKIAGTNLESLIELHKCLEDSILVTEKVDFVLAFYMVHEVPDQSKLFTELKSILKPEGRILIVEPVFHVTGRNFGQMIVNAENAGFKVLDRQKFLFSRMVILG